MASAMPDLRLHPQPQNVNDHQPVPNYFFTEFTEAANVYSNDDAI